MCGLSLGKTHELAVAVTRFQITLFRENVVPCVQRKGVYLGYLRSLAHGAGEWQGVWTGRA